MYVCLHFAFIYCAFLLALACATLIELDSFYLLVGLPLFFSLYSFSTLFSSSTLPIKDWGWLSKTCWDINFVLLSVSLVLYFTFPHF